ncbi:F0F1 ATP synthase subunit B [Candidatus Uhrbacteria bacterium]|nr:F0F1 ATP synthase subunit B [Candidatus Uhrbacteria bacterium]
MSSELDVAKEVVVQSGSFIDTLGLNWKLFIAQIVNFSVVVFVLWRWAYQPLVKLMDDRTRKIEQGLEDAKRAAHELTELEKMRGTTLREAKQEAQRIIEEATQHAEKMRGDLVLKARTDVEKVVHDAKLAIAREKEIMLNEARGHVAELVVAATEKILQEKIDSKKDRELVETTVNSLKH